MLEKVVDAQVGRTVPGVATLVADSSGTQLAQGFGLADLERGEEMTPDSTCNWFSMTKLVTATAVAQLADRGHLDLDAPVVDTYEPFSMLEPDGRARTVTVRHLLSHSGGVANPLPLRWVHLATEPGPEPGSFVEGLLDRHRRLRFEPGSRASYTNLGYLVLGEVVTRVAGTPFEEQVRVNVLEPLGMTRTGFVALEPSRWATPYQRRFTTLGVLSPALIPHRILGPKHRRFRALHHFYVHGAAYGGLVGPPSDAVRFLRAHLRDGELDGVRILSAEAARAMRVTHARGRRIEVGQGWFRRGRVRPADFVEHLGGGLGFWTCLRIYPDRDVGAVVMGNATSYDHDAIVRAGVRAVSSPDGEPFGNL